MYADPKHIRDHVVKVRLNEEEMRLLDALSEYNRSQRAAFARDLLLEAIRSVEAQSSRGPQLMLA